MSFDTSNNRLLKRPSAEPLETTTPSKRARVEDYDETEEAGLFREEAGMFEGAGEVEIREIGDDETVVVEEGEIRLAEWMSPSDIIAATVHNNKRKAVEEGETRAKKKPCYWSDEDLNSWVTRGQGGELWTGSFPFGVEPSVAPPGFVFVRKPEVVLEEEPEEVIVPEQAEQSNSAPAPGLQANVPEEVEQPPAAFPTAPEPAPADVPQQIEQSVFANLPLPTKASFFFSSYTEEELREIQDEEPEKVNVPPPAEQSNSAPTPAPAPRANVSQPVEQSTSGLDWSRFGTKPVQPEPVKVAEPQDVDREEIDVAKIWGILDKELGQGVTKAANPEYSNWHAACTAFFEQGKKAKAGNIMMITYLPFPRISGQFCTASGKDCVRAEKLKICQHDVLRVLRGLGVQMDGEAWVERLKQERLRWHPDRFNAMMSTRWGAEAQEMFQVIQALIEKEQK